MSSNVLSVFPDLLVLSALDPFLNGTLVLRLDALVHDDLQLAKTVLAVVLVAQPVIVLVIL